MTLTELRERTDQKFEMIAVCHDTENILFAVPIPGAFHLHHITTETGETVILDPMDDWMDAWDEYAAKLPNRRYRTRQLADKADKLPTNLPIITIHPWESAMSLSTKGTRLIMMGDDIRTHLDYKDDKLYYDGREIQQSDLDMLLNIPNAPMPAAEKTDLQTLRFLYGTLLKKYNQNIEDIAQLIGTDAKQFLSHNVTIYIPDYVKALGMSRNINQDTVNRIVGKISSYSSLWGIVETNESGRLAKGYYPVMVFLGYEEADNTITFTSPYMNRIIILIIQDSIKRDKGGSPLRKKSGQLVTRPSHSFHVKPSIIKNSSEWAKDIVDVICALMDKAGDTCPHIRYSSIIDRCDGFNEYLAAQPSKYKRNRVLQRSFSTAWKLLAKDTDLMESFRALKLPDPDNPQTIPTMQTLDHVITFPHKGKIRQSEQWAKQPK